MPVITIQLKNIQSLQDIYQQLGEQVQLPADFGSNLDALYDFFTVSLAGPVVIHWPDQLQNCQRLNPKERKGILNVLEDVVRERDDFEVRLNKK
ncbi:barstar family protein [Deefgea tanakiae]|jgi:ribonuclease inhibitor|uniref:Barstar family protein n=1 Tax=Deefgea tanakiae TaxID=2865840 RepID=A0ABX8Z9V7_9NEIS|nr:barstar family protein [Deefgea tanakiae]QZA79356.1 barstar family protein [Deefgea tanakiae]